MNAWRYESLEADTLVPVRYIPFATAHFFFFLFSCPNSQQAKNKKWKKKYPTKGNWEHDPYDHVNPNQWLMKHHLYLWQIIQKGKAPPPTPTPMPISFPNVSFSYAIGFGIWSELHWNVDPMSCVSWACHGNVTYHSHSHLFNVIMTFDKRREKCIIQKMEWNKIK